MESRQLKNKTIVVIANFDVGLYKFRKALLKRLISDGNRVYVLLPSGELIPKLRDIGCEYIETAIERRGMNPFKDLSLFRTYRRLLKKIRPDLVITYTVKPNIYGGIACRLLKIPYSANITGLGSALEGSGVLKKLVLSMYKFALKKAKVVFFENEGNKDTLVGAGVVNEAHTCVLNGAGIDTSEYSLTDYPPSGPVNFLFVGRIMKEKGIDELYSAISKLKSEYGDGVRLDVVGMFEESYQRQTELLNNQGVIDFHGFRNDVADFYAKAHCVVLPSYHEGMSNVLLEAGAMGRPLITSNIHGCMEAVIDNTSGFLCKPKSADSLYVAMKHFIELSYADKMKMAVASFEYVSLKFDKEAVVEETLKHLY